MDEINLDFLKTPPRQNELAERTASPFVYNSLDVGFGKKKYGSKRFEMAQTIAKVDELVKEIEKLKSQNTELQQQLKGFQMISQQVQELYSKEKSEHSTIKHKFEKLQKEYNKIDVDLTNMSMVNGQINARLAEYEGRPINFNNLVVKYVKIMNKLEGEDILRYCSDRDLVERLREYCTAMKLKIPPANSPKKSRSRRPKIKTQDAIMQCDLLQKTSLQEYDNSRNKNKSDMQVQNSQCSAMKRDQASQYISTMITRQTNTEKIVQKHVQTMFPEVPAIDDILKVYCTWSNIRSISPLLESPARLNIRRSNEMLEKFSTTGTCTMLCNIRRKIDYLPQNSSFNIKQEITTPSASPTPTSLPATTCAIRASSISGSLPGNINPSSILNLFNSTTNSSLGQLSPNAFNELWQIFGKMLLSLLQTSNAGIANTTQTSALNQQQFLDWLLERYMSSQEQTTATAQTQTFEQIVISDPNILTSPLAFNDTSVLTNVVKPQPQKPLTASTNLKEGSNNVSSNSIVNNSVIHTSIAYTSNVPLEGFSKESNCMDIEKQQIQLPSNTTELQTSNICKSKLRDIHKIIHTAEKHAKPSSKSKNKPISLNQIEDHPPEINSNKKKLKAFKRLVKINKKSFETRKNSDCNNKQSSVVVLTSESNNGTTETAVDFLKTFAITQDNSQPLEENFSETERIFLKQISNKYVSNNDTNVFNAEELSCIKPSYYLPHTQPLPNTKSYFIKPPIKCKTPATAKQIANKYQLLFGDSDSEFEEHGTELINSELNLNSVIKSTENSCRSDGNCNVNECTDINSNNREQQSYGQVRNSESRNSSIDDNLNLNNNATLKNTPKQQFSLANKQATIFTNNYNPKSSHATSIQDIPTPNIEKCLTNDGYNVKENRKISKIDTLSDNVAISIEEKDLNNFIEEDRRKSDVLTFDKAMLPLEDTSVERNKPATEKEIKHLPTLNNNEYSYNKTLDSNYVLATKYFSDFEEDLELSSDNDSLISESDLNGPHSCSSSTIENSTDNEFNKEICNSNLLDITENGCSKKEVSLKCQTNVESKQKDNELHNWEESFKAFNSNLSNKPKQQNRKTEGDSISIMNSEKEQEHIKTIQNCDSNQPHNKLTNSNKRIEFVESNSLMNSDDDSISLSSFKKQEGNINSIQNYDPNQQKYIELSNFESSLNILEITALNESKGESPKQTKKELKSNPYNDFKITKGNAESNCNDSCNLFQSSCNITIPTGSQKSVQNFAENKCLREENIPSENKTSSNFIDKKYLEAKHILSKTKEEKKSLYEDTLTSSSLNEENSLLWSVITISDSTLNNETLNSNELLETSKSKSDNEVIPGLNSAKVLESTNTDNHSKKIHNSPNDTTAVEDLIEVPINSDIVQVFEAKDDIHYSKTNQVARRSSIFTKTLNMAHENYLIEQDINCTQEIKRSLKNADLNIELSLNKFTLEKLDLSDSTSTEDDLVIDETIGNKSPQLEMGQSNNPIILKHTEENCSDTINSTQMSNLLSSSLCNEILTDSLNPIVYDLLENDVLMTTSLIPAVKAKRGCKRRSECLAELQPCKRSQRLKAKQMMLEESLKLSTTPIEYAKHTKGSFVVEDDVKTKKININRKLPENKNTQQMGFFRERDEETKILKSNKTFTATESQISDVKNDKTFTTIFDEAEEKLNQAQQIQPNFKREQQWKYKYEEENQINPIIECGQEQEKSDEQKDCISKTHLENSPQSPAPIEPNDGHKPETFVIIPLERPPEFMLQDKYLTLFDALIDSYKPENQKKVLTSISVNERNRQEHILNRFDTELKLYCYNEMELELYCTPTHLINKLLSISPDYNLIQKAVLTVAQNAEGANVPEKDLPSIIQEMPPRHLSKCLQRLFAFLENIDSRKNCFCKDLNNKIELMLFNSKHSENLSLQATLNLTQLYVMSCKVQEYLQMSKNPTRLFIAKCLYFYVQKSVLMVHEVLMWYPTVLPFREDKTYDRSDALISVIQQILMNTKYDMDKTDLRSKTLLSKLRYEYHYEPFKPSLQDVVNILVEKLKNSKFYNISMAFALLCRRLNVSTVQHIVLNQVLLPLANEYYSLALKTNEYDKRIEVLLEIISMLVKPLPIEIDTQNYFNEFARFLNGFERQVIQEAALCSIIRLQRFNVEYCYNLLRHLQPTYDLKTHTQAMLKTFLYRRSLTFWRNLKSQNPINYN